jgi:phosphate-selective porin OprO/OprP
MPDFGGGAVVVRDAYFDTRFSNTLRIRVGKGKIPLGLERLQLVNAILFVERSFVTGLTPDRDTGVQALGDLSAGIVTYAAAVTNGNPEGGTADVDANEGKELSARVVVRPWARNTAAGTTNLGIGIGATTGTQGPTLPTYRSSALQTFFSYAPGVTGDGRRTRVSPQVFLYRGPFGGFAEYIRSSGAVLRGAVRSTTLDNSAWNISASWVLTGEAASDRLIRPNKSFDPPYHQWGALQVAARYHQLTVDDDTFALSLAAPGSSEKAQAVTVGVNWYPNPFIKFVFNVERTVFDGDANGPRPAENALLLRGQLSF